MANMKQANSEDNKGNSLLVSRDEVHGLLIIGVLVHTKTLHCIVVAFTASILHYNMNVLSEKSIGSLCPQFRKLVCGA